jgi:hypothetical protein
MLNLDKNLEAADIKPYKKEIDFFSPSNPLACICLQEVVL